MKYEGYTSQQRADDILDKISKYGIDSLSISEKAFLDAHASGEEEKIHNQIFKEETETIFEDDFGYFKFEHLETEDYGDEKHYIGILYVPDLKIGRKKIDGRLEGRIILYSDGSTSPDFFYYESEEVYYDIFEFCEGIEFELDAFIDYVAFKLYGNIDDEVDN